MKGVYSRYKTHKLVSKDPNTLKFTSTKTAMSVTLVLFSAGIVLIVFALSSQLPASFVFGGIVLLMIGVISSMAWMESIDRIVEKRSGMLSIFKYSPIKKNESLIMNLSNIAAIQVLAVELGDAYDVIVTTYEINIVLSSPVGKRFWLVSYGNHGKAKQVAIQVAKLLDCPVIEHTATQQDNS